MNAEESQYLNLCKEIMVKGDLRMDRTGTGTLSVFGRQMRFDLKKSFPLLTTKKIFFRGVVEELLWFISGKTDSNILKGKKINFWNEYGTREFLDKNGFGDRQEGDLGPIYGFQWRHFDSEYKTCNDVYEGIDQLDNIIKTIKTNPYDRRIVMSAWNPRDLNKMVLPPCHCLVQFYVNSKKELSCQLYQRSGDMGLGIPFNIASYSLLTCMIAHITNLTPGEFIHTIGDAHVYLNHVKPLTEQCEKKPNEFPSLKFKRNITDINDFTFEDIELINYNPNNKIYMEMSI